MKWFRRLLISLLAATGLAGATQADTLVVLAEGVPVSHNPDGATSSVVTNWVGWNNMLEPLVYFPKGEVGAGGVQLYKFGEFEGRLAESWSYDPATLTWTFNLRKGVKGCNGATFNADDVLYTFARAKSVSGSSPIGWFLASTGSVDGFTPAVFAPDESGVAARKLGDEVKKIDDYTVQVRQSGPNQLFLTVLTIHGLLIFDKETMEANATEDDPWSHNYANNVNVAGFGAYCLESWDEGSEFVLSSNTDYYRGVPFFDRVIVRKVPQTSNRLAILRAGQADIAERLTPKEYENLRNAGNVKVVETYGNKNLYLILNYNVPPFDNVLVRKAIAHALPYQRIIDTSYFDKARKWASLVPSAFPGFHAASTQYDYNPEKARALLAEAGYPEGKGLEAFPDAFKLVYVLEVESVVGPSATLIRSALQDIGISIALDPIPMAQYGDRELVKRDLPMGLTDHIVPIGPDAAYATLLSFVSVAKGGVLNSANFSSDLLDNLLFGSLVEVDNNKRNEMLAEIQEIMMDEIPVIPIVEYITQVATGSDITGISWQPDNSLRLFNLSRTE